MKGFDLQLPDGFSCEGTMDFLKANVYINRDELARVFRNVAIYHVGGMMCEDPELVGQTEVAVRVNGSLYMGTIVNMNQHGQLILLLKGNVGDALGVSNGEFYFYVRTRPPIEPLQPVVFEGGVMVHHSKGDPEGPVHGDHADAIMAYSYMVPLG